MNAYWSVFHVYAPRTLVSLHWCPASMSNFIRKRDVHALGLTNHQASLNIEFRFSVSRSKLHWHVSWMNRTILRLHRRVVCLYSFTLFDAVGLLNSHERQANVVRCWAMRQTNTISASVLQQNNSITGIIDVQNRCDESTRRWDYLQINTDLLQICTNVNRLNLRQTNSSKHFLIHKSQSNNFTEVTDLYRLQRSFSDVYRISQISETKI